MNKISVKRFAFAWGITGTLLYIGHMLLVLTVGSEITLSFLYNALYGLDVTKISHLDILLWKISLGMTETFFQGGITGGCIALIYNISLKSKAEMS